MAKGSKKKAVQRTRMSDEQAEKFLRGYLKDHKLSGKLAEKFVRHTAATRLAALGRYSKKVNGKKK